MVAYNLYAYCSNNPVMHTDPSGHAILTAFLIGLAIGAAIGFTSAIYEDYEDDGEVFNGSVDVVDYVDRTLVGAAVGGVIGAATPIAGAILTSGFASGSVALAGGGTVAIAETLAISGTATIVAGIVFFANRSGKEMSSQHPSWVNKDMVDPNLSAQQNAKNILNNRYGPGNWNQGPKTEYNQIVKWIVRKLFYGR